MLLITLLSCGSITPQENFKRFRDANIGKSIDDPSSEVARYPQLLVGRKDLPNGNYENEYRWYRECRYFYEINPSTRMIVNWRYEGNENDCKISN